MSDKWKITLSEDLDGFLGTDPDNIALIDVEASQEAYERAMTTKIRALYPELEVDFDWNGGPTRGVDDAVEYDPENYKYLDGDLMMAEDEVYQRQDFWVKKYYASFQEISGHESGAVYFNDDKIIVDSWMGITGIPRLLMGSVLIGLKEPLQAIPLDLKDIPTAAVDALQMQSSDTLDDDDYLGWRVLNGEEVVYLVTHKMWQ